MAEITHVTLTCGKCGKTATSKAKRGMIPLKPLAGWEVAPRVLCPEHVKNPDELIASRPAF
jgi:hypothetical protein